MEEGIVENLAAGECFSNQSKPRRLSLNFIGILHFFLPRSRHVVLYLTLFVNGQNVGVFVFLNKDLQSCHRMFMQIHQRSLESEKQLAIPFES